MRFDDLKFSLGAICSLCSDRRWSFLYFLYSRVGELKVHLLLLFSSDICMMMFGHVLVVSLDMWLMFAGNTSEWPMFFRNVD